MNDVWRLLAEGLSNQGIAEQLHLSRRTVENRVANLYERLHIEQSTTKNARVLCCNRYWATWPHLGETTLDNMPPGA